MTSFNDIINEIIVNAMNALETDYLVFKQKDITYTITQVDDTSAMVREENNLGNVKEYYIFRETMEG